MQSNLKKERALPTKIGMRSRKKEGSTQVVQLNRKKSVCCVSAPDTEKEDGIEETPSAALYKEKEHQSTHTHHDSSLQTIKKTNPKS